MATCAGGIGAVLLHHLAQRQRLSISSAVFQTRNIRRWRRGWCAKYVVQQPLAPQNQRRPVGIRGHSQQTAMAQESAARVKFPAECHAPKEASADVGNS